MLREDFLAEICEDVGNIYQLTCERSAEEVIASEQFQKTAAKIKQERPELNDTAILSMLLRIYSETICNK